MKAKTKKITYPLVKGQLWKMGDSYISIVELGKRLISYKMMRQQRQRAVRTQMASIDSLTAYLRENRAELVD